MEVEKYYISYLKEIALYSIHVYHLVIEIVQTYSRIGEFYYFPTFPLSHSQELMGLNA